MFSWVPTMACPGAGHGELAGAADGEDGWVVANALALMDILPGPKYGRDAMARSRAVELPVLPVSQAGQGGTGEGSFGHTLRAGARAKRQVQGN